jgi:hypothetical protein
MKRDLESSEERDPEETRREKEIQGGGRQKDRGNGKKRAREGRRERRTGGRIWRIRRTEYRGDRKGVPEGTEDKETEETKNRAGKYRSDRMGDRVERKREAMRKAETGRQYMKTRYTRYKETDKERRETYLYLSISHFVSDKE